MTSADAVVLLTLSLISWGSILGILWMHHRYRTNVVEILREKEIHLAELSGARERQVDLASLEKHIKSAESVIADLSDRLTSLERQAALGSRRRPQ